MGVVRVKCKHVAVVINGDFNETKISKKQQRLVHTIQMLRRGFELGKSIAKYRREYSQECTKEKPMANCMECDLERKEMEGVLK